MASVRQDAQDFFSPVVPGEKDSKRKEIERSTQESESFFAPVLPPRKESKSSTEESESFFAPVLPQRKESRSSTQEFDSFFSPVVPRGNESRSSAQEAKESKSSVQEADSFLSPVVSRGRDNSVQEADSFLAPVVSRGNDGKSSAQEAKERKSSVQEADSFLSPVVPRGRDTKSDREESEEWYDSVKEQAAAGTRGVDRTGSKGEADSWMSPVATGSKGEADAWMSPVTTGTKSKASETKTKASEADSHSRSPPATTRVAQLSAKLEGQHRPSRKELDAASKDAPPPRDGPKHSEVILNDKEFGASLASAFARKPPRPAVSGPHAKSNHEKEDEAAGYDDQGRDQKEIVSKEAVDKARKFEKDGKQKTAHEIIEEDKEEHYGFGRRLQDLVMGPVGLGALCAVVAWKVISSRRGGHDRTRVNRRIEIRRKVEVY